MVFNKKECEARSCLANLTLSLAKDVAGGVMQNMFAKPRFSLATAAGTRCIRFELAGRRLQPSHPDPKYLRGSLLFQEANGQ